MVGLGERSVLVVVLLRLSVDLLVRPIFGIDALMLGCV
jgi:hypothetical protein